MSKNPIPSRLSWNVEALLVDLARGARSPWTVWNRINRGVRTHRVVWKFGLREVPMFDVCRALGLGLVEAESAQQGGNLSGTKMGAHDVEGAPANARIRLRVTPLGRATLAARDLKRLGEDGPRAARVAPMPILLPKRTP